MTRQKQDSLTTEDILLEYFGSKAFFVFRSYINHNEKKESMQGKASALQKANLVFSLVMEKYTGFEFAQRVGEHKVRLHMHQAKDYPRTLETGFPGNCTPIQSLGTSY